MATPFRVTRRVEFHDTDMAGIVHFSNFFCYMEYAEVELLRSKGLTVSWRETNGERIGFPRVSATCDYRRPVRFDDVLEIAVTIGRVGRRSVTYEFEFFCRGEAVAQGKVSAAYCLKHADGRLEAIDIPADMRAKLEG
ncbi:MAG TPA: thioesterase family protein [Gemmataceae bacterium]|jgi:YbgC/YbaW family acyl-CoA thioester hydrolase